MKYTDSHPAHDRESCSDLYAINVDPAGSHGCARCTALALDALQAATIAQTADARDAARYRLLRDTQYLPQVFAGVKGYTLKMGKELDDICDAAIDASEE
jgi:hypothetical protein